MFSSKSQMSNPRSAPRNFLKGYLPNRFSIHAFKAPTTVASYPSTVSAEFGVGYYMPLTSDKNYQQPNYAPVATTYSAAQYNRPPTSRTIIQRRPQLSASNYPPAYPVLDPTAGKSSYKYNVDSATSTSSTSTSTESPSTLFSSPADSTSSTSTEIGTPRGRRASASSHVPFPLHIPALAEAQLGSMTHDVLPLAPSSQNISLPLSTPVGDGYDEAPSVFRAEEARQEQVSPSSAPSSSPFSRSLVDARPSSRNETKGHVAPSLSRAQSTTARNSTPFPEAEAGVRRASPIEKNSSPTTANPIDRVVPRPLPTPPSGESVRGRKPSIVHPFPPPPVKYEDISRASSVIDEANYPLLNPPVRIPLPEPHADHPTRERRLSGASPPRGPRVARSQSRSPPVTHAPTPEYIREGESRRARTDSVSRQNSVNKPVSPTNLQRPNTPAAAIPRTQTPFPQRRRFSDSAIPAEDTSKVPAALGTVAEEGGKHEPRRRYTDGSDYPPRRRRPSVRWNENLVCPSPIFPHQRRKGWFNRRGDQLWTNSGAYKQPPVGEEYPTDLECYPDYGEGWMNEEGIRIDMMHRLIPKVPLRSALKPRRDEGRFNGQ